MLASNTWQLEQLCCLTSCSAFVCWWALNGTHSLLLLVLLLIPPVWLQGCLGDEPIWC